MAADYGVMEVAEFARWQREGKDFTLLDVRQDIELRFASIPGALHIPMHEMQSRVQEIPHDKPVVVMCHVGERSARVAHFLVAGGYTDVFNLDGGIDAYAVEIDRDVGRY